MHRILRLILLPRHLPSFGLHWIRKRLGIRNLLFGISRYARCWLNNELEVSEFFEFRLWRCERTTEECLEFIGWRKHIHSLLILSPAQYRCATENKLIFHDLCRSCGLATPEILGIYDPCITSSAGIRLVRNIAELRVMLEQLDVQEVIMKPVEGTRGQSILTISYVRQSRSFTTSDSRELTETEFANALAPYTYQGACQSTYLIQSRVLPSPDTKFQISQLVPFSYRFLTLWDENEGAQIIFAYGKAATNKGHADNLHAGGLALLIDNEGVCFGARSADNWAEILTAHPTTGAELKGWKCPEYQRAASIALEAAVRFRFVRCVAWDVLVGCNIQGDVVVQVLEGNNPFNYDIQLVCDSGMWTNRFANEVERVAKLGLDRSPWW